MEPWLAPSFSCSLADGKLLIFVIQKLSTTTINLYFNAAEFMPALNCLTTVFDTHLDFFKAKIHEKKSQKDKNGHPIPPGDRQGKNKGRKGLQNQNKSIQNRTTS